MSAYGNLDAASVAVRLGIGDDDRPWLVGLDALGPPPGGLRLPTGPDLVARLRRLGVEDADVDELAAAAPDRARTPELWWLLERCAARVIATVGRWDADSGPWPALPRGLGMQGRCFWAYAYVAALPEVRRWHRERGVPDDISWATLADLGRHVADYRRRTGAVGFDAVRWMGLHFSGAIYALGRLQFNPYHLRTRPAGPLFWYEPPDPRAGEEGLRPGDPALGMHIPEAGPLTPEECDASVRAARAFFAARFPEHRFRVVTCTSWLLDDQLATRLPATSNIVRFQRRFELVPGAWDHDDDIFQFVFHRPPSAIDSLTPRTTLERAIVDHVRAGGTWRLRTGWLEPPPA